MKGADKAATSISMITDNHIKVLKHQLWIKCHMQLYDDNTMMLRSERVFGDRIWHLKYCKCKFKHLQHGASKACSRCLITVA